MPQLMLDDDEAHALERALRSYLSDLRSEIGATDGADMRDELKREEALLGAILQRLPGPSAAT
jgi:hypothetical protein